MESSVASGRSRGELLCLAAIALCFLFQLFLALRMEINWDEFFFLSHLYDFQRGEMSKALQSLQVYLLGWITLVPGYEIDQILIGRLVMLGCELVTCLLIYRLARQFADRLPSLIAVLAFASSGFTLVHGASFRADPLATALSMLALVSFSEGERTSRAFVLAALPIAVGAMITVKVGLYAPAFAGLALWRYVRSEDRLREGAWMVGVLLLAIVAFAALYILQLAMVPESSTAASRSMLGNAAQTTLLSGALLPRGAEIARAVTLSPIQSVLFSFGALAAVDGAVRSKGATRLRFLAGIACSLPVLCLLFYRNAFPYFFPFIMAPAMVLIALAVQARPEISAPRRIELIIVILVAFAALVTVKWSSRDLGRQSAIVQAVHLAFPRPVPVIDRNSMIASFPKTGFFMSTWGMQNYLRGGPLFERILANEAPPILILNHPWLEDAVGQVALPADQPRLFPEDVRVLRESYIPHWGPLWVAGKRLEVSAAPKKIQVWIPGLYTVEGVSAEINGQLVGAGQTVHLERGAHMIVGRNLGIVTLRWGDHLRRPAMTPPAGPVYQGTF